MNTQHFACLRYVAPGETHSVPCDHAGVCYAVNFISFTPPLQSKTYTVTLEYQHSHSNEFLLLEEEKTGPVPRTCDQNHGGE